MLLKKGSGPLEPKRQNKLHNSQCDIELLKNTDHAVLLFHCTSGNGQGFFALRVCADAFLTTEVAEEHLHPAVDFLSGTPNQATFISIEYTLGEIQMPLLVWVSSHPPLLCVVEVGGHP